MSNTSLGKAFIKNKKCQGVAQSGLERVAWAHEVGGSTPLTLTTIQVAEWPSLVGRSVWNRDVAGSNPVPATTFD